MSLIWANIFICVLGFFSFFSATKVLYQDTKEMQQKLQQKVEHVIW